MIFFAGRRCYTLKPVINGEYRIVPFNILGAKALYTCSKGYVLNGTPERVCQGDGHWSKSAPTCEKQEISISLTPGKYMTVQY